MDGLPALGWQALPTSIQRRENQRAEGDAAPAGDSRSVPVAGPADGSNDWGRFERGYLESGGRPEWLTHFVKDVLPCEGGAWAGYYGQNGYWTRAQFSLDTWETIVGMFSVIDQRRVADDPYFVGQAVAWWSSVISYPGDSSGWPTCWWRGAVP